MPAVLTNHTRAVTAAVLACGALGLTACGTKTVETGDVEKEISTKLEEQQGVKPDKVECPEDMEAKKGKKYTCTLTAEGQELKTEVTMTDDDGKFEFEVQAPAG